MFKKLFLALIFTLIATTGLLGQVRVDEFQPDDSTGIGFVRGYVRVDSTSTYGFYIVDDTGADSTRLYDDGTSFFISSDNSISFAGQTIIDGGTVTTVDINGGTIDGVSFGSPTFTGDVIIYNPVNDANPQIRIGSVDAEEVHFQAVFDGGATTLDYILFQTDVVSGIADKGEYRFNVDGTLILTIDDGGLEVVGGLLTTTASTFVGDVSLNGDLDFLGAHEISTSSGDLAFNPFGSLTAAGETWIDLGSVTTVDINGGTIDGVIIGGTSAAAGTFTSVTATSFVIGANTLTTTEWANLDNINQSLSTSDNVSFGTIGGTAITGTSFVIGANTLTTTEWANLDNINQTVSTTSSPTFAQVTIDNLIINNETLTSSNGNIVLQATATIGNDIVLNTDDDIIFNSDNTGGVIATTNFGSMTFDEAFTLSTSVGNITFNPFGSLTAAGETWINLGTVTTIDINGGTIDGTTIGAASATTVVGTSITGTSFVIGANTLTTTEWANLDNINQSLSTSDNVSFAQVTVDNLVLNANTFSSSAGQIIFNATTTLTAAGETWINLGTVTTIDINGGTIDGTTIGAASATTVVGTSITGTSFVIGANTLTTSEWSNLDGINQTLSTGSSVSFAQVTIDNLTINNSTLTASSGGIVLTATAGAGADIVLNMDDNLVINADNTGGIISLNDIGFMTADEAFTLSTTVGNLSLTATAGAGADVVINVDDNLNINSDNTGGVIATTNFGSMTFDEAFTLSTSVGNITFNPAGSLTAAGETWINLGTVTTVDINGGTIDGVTFGGGTFTTIDINGGTIDGTTIGASSRSTGAFTTLNANSGGALTGTWSNLGTVTTVDINGGTIDGTTIGAASATTIVGTAITGTSFVIGANTLTTTEWSKLDGINQSLSTSDNVSFGTIGGTAITGTSFVIGANTLTTTEWSKLDGINQTVSTGSSVSFAQVTVDNMIFNNETLTSSNGNIVLVATATAGNDIVLNMDDNLNINSDNTGGVIATTNFGSMTFDEAFTLSTSVGNIIFNPAGSLTAAGETWINLGSVTTVDINGGTIDGVTFGGGTFTTIDINGGTIDGTTIGASSRSTGAFTSIAGNTDVTIYEPVNNGDPHIFLGSSATNQLDIKVDYTASLQSLDFVEFRASTTSGNVNAGEMRFYIDDILKLTIDDSGIEVVGGVMATTASTFVGDMSLNGDLDFVGPQRIFVSSGDLTLNATAAGGDVVLLFDDNLVINSDNTGGIISLNDIGSMTADEAFTISTSVGDLTLNSAGQIQLADEVVQQTFVIRKVFNFSGLVDNTSTPVLNITLITGEKGSYAVNMRAIVQNTETGGTEDVAAGYLEANFVRSQNDNDVGFNISFIETFESQLRGTNESEVGIGDVFFQNLETTELITVVRLNVDGIGTSTPILSAVILVELFYTGFTTPPVLTIP